MSMFTISGVVINTYDPPPRKAEDGKEEESKPKVQIMGDMPVPGGQKRMDLVTLSCEDKGEYEALRGKTIAVALGIFSPARGQVVYFIPKGARPVVISDKASG